MSIFEAILKILLYVSIMFMLLLSSKRITNNKKSTLKNIPINQNVISFPFYSAFILSVVVGWYSGWIFPITSDRNNYAFRFIKGIYVDGTYGLRWISQTIRRFTDNPQIYFLFVSFLCVFITLFAINKYKIKSRLPIVLLVSSTLIPSSFYLLKQAPAVAFASLAIAMYLNKKKVYTIIFTLIAILFHESAIILLPLYVIVNGARKAWIRITIYGLFILFLFFFRQLVSIILPIANTIDYIGSQTVGFEEAIPGSQGLSNIITTIKGMPLYVISAYALINRKYFRACIVNYDKYLTIIIFGSLSVLLSTYNYWMFRFAMYSYIPSYVFAGLIYQNIKAPKIRLCFGFLVTGLLAFFTLRSLFQIYTY